MKRQHATQSSLETAGLSAIDVLYRRRSVREFAQTPINPDAIERIIDAAIQAPSAMNEQPWRFTVLTSKARLASIAANAKAYALEQLAEGPHIDHLRETLGDPSFDIFYRAPTLVVISAARHSRWAVEDCAMAAQNLMLAACALRLGTCWIGFAQDWLNTTEGLSAIGLDESQLVVAPIIIGHPAKEPPVVARREPHIDWIKS
jgi:nitroreductase